VAGGGDVGDKDADLAIFHAPGASAILGSDTRGVASAFGEATFVKDEDRKNRFMLGAGGDLGRGMQALRDQRTKIIAHAILVPDGTRKQALHAIGSSLPGMFGDLPAIFARDITEDGLQGEEQMVMNFGACKAGTQVLMEVEQALVPTADLTQAWLNEFGCGMLNTLHADLLSKRRCNGERLRLLACHIEKGMARRNVQLQGILQGELRGKCLAFHVRTHRLII
jgi:hypothetical protein